MSFPIRPALLPALLLWLCGPAFAQTARPAPDDPRAPVPAVQYQSPLAGYRAHAEPDVGSWRAANERVGQVGGWKAYAREAAQTQPASPGTAQPAQHSHAAKPEGKPDGTSGAPGTHAHGQAAPDQASGMHGPQHHQMHQQKPQHHQMHQQKHQQMHQQKPQHHQHHGGTP